MKNDSNCLISEIVCILKEFIRIGENKSNESVIENIESIKSDEFLFFLNQINLSVDNLFKFDKASIMFIEMLFYLYMGIVNNLNIISFYENFINEIKNINELKMFVKTIENYIYSLLDEPIDTIDKQNYDILSFLYKFDYFKKCNEINIENKSMIIQIKIGFLYCTYMLRKFGSMVYIKVNKDKIRIYAFEKMKVFRYYVNEKGIIEDVTSEYNTTWDNISNFFRIIDNLELQSLKEKKIIGNKIESNMNLYFVYKSKKKIKYCKENTNTNYMEMIPDLIFTDFLCSVDEKKISLYTPISIIYICIEFCIYIYINYAKGQNLNEIFDVFKNKFINKDEICDKAHFLFKKINNKKRNYIICEFFPFYKKNINFDAFILLSGILRKDELFKCDLEIILQIIILFYIYEAMGLGYKFDMKCNENVYFLDINNMENQRDPENETNINNKSNNKSSGNSIKNENANLNQTMYDFDFGLDQIIKLNTNNEKSDKLNIIPDSEIFYVFLNKVDIERNTLFLCDDISIIHVCINYCIYIQIYNKMLFLDTFNNNFINKKNIVDYALSLHKEAKKNNYIEKFQFFKFIEDKNEDFDKYIDSINIKPKKQLLMFEFSFIIKIITLFYQYQAISIGYKLIYEKNKIISYIIKENTNIKNDMLEEFNQIDNIKKGKDLSKLGKNILNIKKNVEIYEKKGNIKKKKNNKVFFSDSDDKNIEKKSRSKSNKNINKNFYDKYEKKIPKESEICFNSKQITRVFSNLANIVHDSHIDYINRDIYIPKNNKFKMYLKRMNITRDILSKCSSRAILYICFFFYYVIYIECNTYENPFDYLENENSFFNIQQKVEKIFYTKTTNKDKTLKDIIEISHDFKIFLSLSSFFNFNRLYLLDDVQIIKIYLLFYQYQAIIRNVDIFIENKNNNFILEIHEICIRSSLVTFSFKEILNVKMNEIKNNNNNNKYIEYLNKDHSGILGKAEISIKDLKNCCTYKLLMFCMMRVYYISVRYMIENPIKILSKKIKTEEDIKEKINEIINKKEKDTGSMLLKMNIIPNIKFFTEFNFNDFNAIYDNFTVKTLLEIVVLYFQYETIKTGAFFYFDNDLHLICRKDKIRLEIPEEKEQDIKKIRKKDYSKIKENKNKLKQNNNDSNLIIYKNLKIDSNNKFNIVEEYINLNDQGKNIHKENFKIDSNNKFNIVEEYINLNDQGKNIHKENFKINNTNRFNIVEEYINLNDQGKNIHKENLKMRSDILIFLDKNLFVFLFYICLIIFCIYIKKTFFVLIFLLGINLFINKLKKPDKLEKYICYISILLCYLVIMIKIDHILLKYFLPIFISFLEIKKKYFLLLINLCFFIDYDICSLFFICNIFFSIYGRKVVELFYRYNSIIIIVLILFNVNQKMFLFWSCLSIFLYDHEKKYSVIIFYLIFAISYSYQITYNSNLYYEFNEGGLLVNVLYYSIPISMYFTEFIKQEKKKKIIKKNE